MRRKSVAAATLFLLLLLILSLAVFSVPAHAAEPLFADIDGKSVSFPAKEGTNKTVTRSRMVQVRFGQVAGKDIPTGADSILLNLFSDVSFLAVKDRFEERSSGKYTWFGTIQNVEHSSVVIVVEKGVMSGNITLPDGFYQIRFVSDGVYSVRQIDQSAFPDEAPPVRTEEPSGEPSGEPSYLAPTTPADTGEIIDLMVVYTATTRAAAGGADAIESLIQLGVDETNQAYTSSNITQRLRLVHTVEVNYPETGDLCDDNKNSDLPRLKGKHDGYMDEIHGLRDTYGADLVSLVVENGNACGCGYMMDNVSTSFEDRGFNVVARECATGYYSFGHELGHNMGANHDWYVSTDRKPYLYAHGYLYPAGKWRTIMAYNDGCTAQGVSCTRVQYFSNPDVNYLGVPTGVAEGSTRPANVRKTFNNTAYTVANFRNSSCAYSIAPTKKSFNYKGGSAKVRATGTGYGTCTNPAVSVSDSSVVTAALASFAKHSGSVNVTVSANTSTSMRTGTVTIGGQTFQVTQDTRCTLASLAPAARSFPSSGGSHSFTVRAAADCPWTASADAAAWITITSGSTGSGTGTVSYTVAANATGKARTGKIDVFLTDTPAKKRVFTVRQAK